jgi:hypothetical protein
LARQCDQPERPDDGGQSQQQRDAGRHERAEGDYKDDQRDRERVEARLRQVVREERVRLIDGAGVAELADEEPGVRALRLGDAVEHRCDLVDRFVLVTADLELDESRAPALGDLAVVRGLEWRLHVLDDVHRGNAGNDVLDRGLEGRIARSERLALDQDALAGGLLEPGVEDPVHAA